MGTKPSDRDWAPLVCGLLAALLVIVLSLQWWDLRIFGTAVDYQHAGTWSQMLSGVGTTCAVALTLAVLWLERRQRRKELAETRDRDLTRVHAWLTPHQSKNENEPEWFLNFQNHTAVPIYRWRVLLGGKDLHLCNALFGPIRPDRSELHLASLRGMNHADYPSTTFYFTTGDGRAWVLGADGGAVEVLEQCVQCDKEH